MPHVLIPGGSVIVIDHNHLPGAVCTIALAIKNQADNGLMHT